jgi:hypothetical protein
MKPWSRLRWVLSVLRFQVSVSRLGFFVPRWSAGSLSPGLIGGGFRSLCEAESSWHLEVFLFRDQTPQGANHSVDARHGHHH